LFIFESFKYFKKTINANKSFVFYYFADNNPDQEGSEASVSVGINLSLYPVRSIDHNFAPPPLPAVSEAVSR
jgi:hypothetical protein